MVRDATATRARLLEAATAEFARYGIAGARIDRIAETARANKSLIYAYFGNKNELFEIVFTNVVNTILSAIPFDATDLPGYAAKSFDIYDRNPAFLRLATWYQLESAEPEPMDSLVGSTSSKIADLAAAQDAGLISARYSPVELLTFTRAISMSWHLDIPRLGAAAPEDLSSRRVAVIKAVTELVTPGADKVDRRSPRLPEFSGSSSSDATSSN